ncbi:LuxR family two component transcriptional regulator [Knoellia remsis]|uniref:LuxR family two component transcriptional regulator n=1 Tax=Knoellia remsis TaxID=407159 RepID=A0A2T0UXR9_9MICO|nr:response regulator transcription factor [Knoellia remsis]PRY62638.1 LuxR family two component transcriptional regulator [Knoellia remsis]
MTASPPPEARTTVLVADDHPLWLGALERDLVEAGLDVVATAGDGPSTVRRARATRPDVLVLDLNLPGMRGDEVCRALGDLETRVLILSASGEQLDVLAAIKAGATGYLVKSASATEIVDAVVATARGEAVFTPGLAGLVLGEFRRMATAGDGDAARSSAAGERQRAADRPIPELTERETEVLRLVATGMSYKEIAAELVLSHRTVQNHVQNTLGKLHLHNRVELVRFALARGLEDPNGDAAGVGD